MNMYKSVESTVGKRVIFGASRWLDAVARSGIAAAASTATQRTWCFMVSSLVFLRGLDMSPCHADCSRTGRHWMQTTLQIQRAARGNPAREIFISQRTDDWI